MVLWEVRDAPDRFSELLDAALKEGPQVVNDRGVKTTVLVSIEEWHRLKSLARPSLKHLLIGPGPRVKPLTERRGIFRRRTAMEF